MNQARKKAEREQRLAGILSSSSTRSTSSSDSSYGGFICSHSDSSSVVPAETEEPSPKRLPLTASHYFSPSTQVSQVPNHEAVPAEAVPANLTCPICRIEKVDRVPKCGHALCHGCCTILKQKKHAHCPICREHLSKVHPLFV